MTEAYNDALTEQLRKNVWDQLKSEAAKMSKLEYASVAAEIIGIFDPTPASDQDCQARPPDGQSLGIDAACGR